MFKSHGKTVVSNDYMAMSATFAKAMIENNEITLPQAEALALLEPNRFTDHFVETKFQGLYFSDDDNRLIDIVRANIKALKNPYKRAIAMSALIRACLKKRPRGIFTYVGHRYDDGRKDLLMTFRAQFLEAVDIVNAAVFNNGKQNKARNGDAMTLQNREPGLVYIDPPIIPRYLITSMCAAITLLKAWPVTGKVWKFRNTLSPRNSSHIRHRFLHARARRKPSICCLSVFVKACWWCPIRPIVSQP